MPASLTVICGPMFAGKTSALITRAGGSPSAAFKPVRDTRYGASDEIMSHAGMKSPARVVSDAAELHGLLSDLDPRLLALIDEAHFFGAALRRPIQSALSRGMRVVVAGLERDHRGEPFEPFPWLLCEADEVVKLTCPCAVCGRPAQHSQRLVPSAERIVVGGAESYQPRCRACFTPGA